MNIRHPFYILFQFVFLNGLSIAVIAEYGFEVFTVLPSIFMFTYSLIFMEIFRYDKEIEQRVESFVKERETVIKGRFDKGRGREET